MFLLFPVIPSPLKWYSPFPKGRESGVRFVCCSRALALRASLPVNNKAAHALYTSPGGDGFVYKKGDAGETGAQTAKKAPGSACLPEASFIERSHVPFTERL